MDIGVEAFVEHRSSVPQGLLALSAAQFAVSGYLPLPGASSCCGSGCCCSSSCCCSW